LPARRRLLTAAATAALITTGCGHSTGTPSPPLRTNQPPNLSAFLQLPVATPSSCPSNVAASASGRQSPWVGRVDISVFVTSAATAPVVKRLGSFLRHAHLVDKLYFESQAQAYAEFQRLYTCSTSVSRSQTPASYRVVLLPGVTFGVRNTFVARVLRQPGVDTVSCDPSVPCVNVVNSASANPAG
jgi:hypothetical protein